MDPANSKRVHLDPEQEVDTTPVRSVLTQTMGAGEGVTLLQAPPLPKVAPPLTPYKTLPSTDSDEEWKYGMRRFMQEIVPGLYLGPYASAAKSQLDGLKNAGITHIVCIRHLVERSVIRPVHEGHFTYLVMEIGDDSTVSLIPFCNRVIKFIDNCFQLGGKVLVHGNAGLNRSAALVVAYIMATYGVGLKESLRFVQSRRFAANPHGWLLNQLQEYEAIYQAMHDYPHPLPAEGDMTPPPLLKRSFAEISHDRDDWSDDEGDEVKLDNDIEIDGNQIYGEEMDC